MIDRLLLVMRQISKNFLEKNCKALRAIHICLSLSPSQPVSMTLSGRLVLDLCRCLCMSGFLCLCVFISTYCTIPLSLSLSLSLILSIFSVLFVSVCISLCLSLYIYVCLCLRQTEHRQSLSEIKLITKD